MLKVPSLVYWCLEINVPFLQPLLRILLLLLLSTVELTCVQVWNSIILFGVYWTFCRLIDVFVSLRRFLSCYLISCCFFLNLFSPCTPIKHILNVWPCPTCQQCKAVRLLYQNGKVSSLVCLKASFHTSASNFSYCHRKKNMEVSQIITHKDQPEVTIFRWINIHTHTHTHILWWVCFPWLTHLEERWNLWAKTSLLFIFTNLPSQNIRIIFK